MKRRDAMQLVVLGAAVPLAAQEAHTHAPAAADAAAAPAKLRFFKAAQKALVDRAQVPDLERFVIDGDQGEGFVIGIAGQNMSVGSMASATKSPAMFSRSANFRDSSTGMIPLT